MLSYHSGLRKTVRWYKKVGVHMVEMMLTNAFYLYVKFAPNPHLNTVKIYREHIVENILWRTYCGEHIVENILWRTWSVHQRKGRNGVPEAGIIVCRRFHQVRRRKIWQGNAATAPPHKSVRKRVTKVRTAQTYQHCASTPAFEFFTRIWVFFGMTLTAIVVMTVKNSKYGIKFQQDFAS